MYHIFLDAEVFRRENLHFASKRFARLIDLVKGKEAVVYLTDVVVGEVRSAVRTSVSSALSILRQSGNRRTLGVLAQIEQAGLRGLLGKLDEGALVADLNSRFDRLLRDSRAIVISTDGVPMHELRRRYFEGLAPFANTSMKRKEFPDAISILAADAYAVKNGIILHMVSGDSGVAAAAQVATALEYAENLQAIIAKVLEAAKAKLATAAESLAEELTETIASRIGAAFSESGFHVEDDYGDVDDVTVDDIDLDRPTVAELKATVATLEFSATISFRAHLTIADPAQTHYDSETGDTLVFGYLDQEVHDTAFVEGEIQVDLSLADLSKSKLLAVILFYSDYGVRFRPDERG
jgi:hypothetical protein